MRWKSGNKLIKLIPAILTAMLTVAPLHSLAADPSHYQSATTIYTVAASELIHHVEYADLDDDGNLDMIIIQLMTDQVGVLRGNGDGTFQVPQLYNVGDSPKSATVGDFNKDGINDIVVGSYNDTTISILIGKADGQYMDAVFYPSGYRSLTVTSGDFNKDGNLDVVATNDGADRISILYGNGNGSFQTAVTEMVGRYPRYVETYDINNDGNLDLICSNDGSNSISVFLGDGNGGFSRQDYPAGTFPNEIAIGDWDGDGVADLALNANGDSGMTILLGNADGSFRAPIFYSSGGGSYPLYLDAGDINNDGRLDILVTTQAYSYVLFLGNGDGTFQSGITYAPPVNVREVNAEDFNGDGIPDLVLKSNSSIELMLSKSEGSIAFNSAAYSVSEDGGSAIVTIVRSDSYGPTTVRLTTTDGSATAGTDYTAVTDTISFLAGETVKTYPIPIDDNTVYSGNRMFTATLSDPSNTVSLGAQSSASITIMEDELPDTTAPTVDVTKFTAIDNYAGTPDQLRGSANAISESGVNVRAYAWNDANADNLIDAGELSATGVNLGMSAADGSVPAAALGNLPPGSYKYVLTATDAAGNESPRVASAAISVNLSKATMPQDSVISPTTATFDINLANQADVATEMTLNGNTLMSIANGGTLLGKDVDYTVVDGTVTIGQSYLAGQSVGSTTLTFTFSAGSEQTLVITVSDSTPPMYGVTYDGNTSDGGTTPMETNQASGATFAAKANTFTKTGYTFAGWNSQADGGGTAYAAGATVTMPSGTLTLYAQWTPITYAVTYAGNTSDGGTAPTETNKAQGAMFAAQANTYTKTGYTFAGWNTQADGGGMAYAASATVTMPSGALTLYAQWTPITYAVTYAGNTSDGGTVPTETNKASGATFAAQANTFTKTGYTFTGWNTQADGGGTAYAAGATVTMPSVALTLYAQWTPITYTISPLPNVTLNNLTTGYASGARDTKTVNVTRTGAGDLTNLATMLSGTNASSFTITQPAETSLNSGAPSTTFTLQPNAGLAAGTYTATVSVSATDMMPVTFTVTQIVISAGDGSSTPPTSPEPEKEQVSDLVIDLNGVPFDPNTIDTTKPSVTLEVTPKGGIVYVSIPDSILTRFAGQNATFFIEIQTPFGSYRVPVNLASLIPGMKDLLAANKLNAEDISFKITLTDKSGDADIQAAFASGLPNGKVMGAIVDFNIEIINIQTKQLIGTADKFSKAMVRIIPMPNELTDLPEQWGAFRYNETKTQFEFVPARKVQIEGNLYVMISSLSNSVYVVADNPVDFTDVRQDWSKPFIDLAAAKGLVSGVGLYDPNKAVTRGEFAAMLVRILGRGHSTNTTAPYEDVKQGAWYYSELAQAKELGLLEFASGNRFKPDQLLTREEMASMLAAAIGLEKLPSTGEKVSLNGYKDIGRIDTIYMEDIQLMVKLNIMTGTSKDMFSPEAETTRAQAAAVLVRTLRVLGFID
ncbi:FG-GAP-like repeat-containing protein [Paenibacillus oryzisoli]|uniref:SLH domain-containing protein n=1 Tax=Paenibacillus oryzisoli TaxID=1850517 RepID=A0A197ZWT3_9BACL|nr:FG-GAP-like repeat-containing protein [Paenibacillus oryzisoli]OAS13282.1 hypothetical protein A8708_10825 [Paenibacillus oryzisoli]